MQNAIKCFSIFSIFFLAVFTSLPVSQSTVVIRDAQIVNQWLNSAEYFEKLVWPQLDRVLNLIHNVTEDNGKTSVNLISPSCAKDLIKVAHGLRNRKIWALKFLESSAGNKPGFLNGYFSDLGSYKDCVSIDYYSNSTNIKGKYCLLKLHLALPARTDENKFESVLLDLKQTPLEDTYFSVYANDIKFFYNNTFTFGFCIPQGCSRQDLENVSKNYLHETSLSLQVHSCESGQQEFMNLPQYQRTAITLLVSLIIFIAICTWVTYFFGNQVSPYVMAFSAIINTKKLAQESKDQASSNLQYLHGIRFSLRVFGLFGHIFLTLGIIPHPFPLFSYSLPSNWFVQETIKQMFIFIEVFFLMSGFLTVYSWYPQMKDKKKVTFGQYTLVRYLRSTPLFLGILLLVFVFAGIGSGPIFSDLKDLVAGNCLQYWWTNLLYVSNWIRPSKMCYLNWWTVSIDFQLYAISYLPMIWLVTKPKKGLISLVTLALLGPLITAFVTFFKKTPLLRCCSLDYDHEDMYAEHFSTYTHSAPYYLGMIVGYFVVTEKKITSKIMQAFCWTIASLFWIGTFVGSYYYVDNKPDTLAEIVYISSQKILFSVFYMWLFYAFSLKMGGMMEKNLGAKLFVPYSRLSYSISMSEMLFIWYDLANSHQYFPVDSYNMIMRVTYIFTVCSLLGYFVYLLFEAPTVNLLKLLKSNIVKDAKNIQAEGKVDKLAMKDFKNGKIE